MTTKYLTTTDHARFLLLGDCHAGALGRAAKAVNFPFCGGPVAAALELHGVFFDSYDDDVIFRGSDTEAYYRGFLADLGLTSLSQLAVPLVSTFGFSAHLPAHNENWHIYRNRSGDFPPGFLTSSLFEEIILAMTRGALDFYRFASDHDLRVLALLAPQRVPAGSDPAVFMAAQDVIRLAVQRLGAEIVDIRARTTDATGLQRAEFCDPGNQCHGNLAFGRLLLNELVNLGL
ncbi:hypothetical protein [Micromonospora sp. NPDC005172]|uniref:hypothetical protein n=1 Tax=Micromonospora sp. NPDC005172 TaxID=3156867 RepID=UPI00339E5C21